MKNKIYLFLFALVTAFAPCVSKAQTAGEPALFNSDWSFHKGDIANGITRVKT